MSFAPQRLKLKVHSYGWQWPGFPGSLKRDGPGRGCMRQVRSPESDVQTTKLISSHVKHDWQEALHIFNLVKTSASVVTFNVAISACARGAIWQEALLLLEDLASQRLQGTVISYSAVINSCEKAGEWRCALACLDAMKHKRLEPNVIAFNAALSACTKGSLAVVKACLAFPNL